MTWELGQGGGAPTGPAGGDLTGSNYPNPVVAANKITAAKMSSGAATVNQVPIADGAGNVNYASVPAATPPYQTMYAARGILTESWDGPLVSSASALGNPDCRAILMKDAFPVGAVITGIVLGIEIQAAGTVPTAFLAGIARQGADSTHVVPVALSSNLNASASLTTLGLQKFPLSAPYTVVGGAAPNDTLLYAIFCMNGAFSISAPQISAGPTSSSTSGRALGTNYAGRGVNFVITTLVVGTPVALTVTNANTPWMALY
jgi:hypothetical protein